MAGRVMRKEWVKGWRGGEKKGSKAKRGVRKEGKGGGEVRSRVRRGGVH